MTGSNPALRLKAWPPDCERERVVPPGARTSRKAGISGVHFDRLARMRASEPTDPIEREVFEEALLIGESVETAAAMIEALGLSKDDVAEKLSLSVSELDELLINGGEVTIADLSRLALAIGFRWLIVPVERDDGAELPVWAHRMLHGRRAPKSARDRVFSGADDD